MTDPTTLIAALGLQPHPEGGFYRETYRAPIEVPAAALPAHFAGGPRAAATSIYFRLGTDDFSALHRIAADELWFFHAGDTLEVIGFLPGQSSPTTWTLGLPPDGVPYALVPAGTTFGSRVRRDGPTTPRHAHGFALVSCVVAPGFDFRDFAMPDRATLLSAYPDHAALVTSLTR
jgi:hypothetical protein